MRVYLLNVNGRRSSVSLYSEGLVRKVLHVWFMDLAEGDPDYLPLADSLRDASRMSLQEAVDMFNDYWGDQSKVALEIVSTSKGVRV